MSVISAAPPLINAVLPADSFFRLSVKQYHEMIDAGILTTDDRVELVEGWLVTKMSKGPLHAAPLAVSTDTFFRLSVKQYHEMIEAGILTTEDRVELLEGILVRKMPKYPRHSFSTQQTRDALARVVSQVWFVNSQEPVTTGTSEPEPDVSVHRGQRKQYSDAHPGPENTALLVEVSESSLQRDRGFKKRIYATARIPIYWIINLIDNQIEVYSDPTGPAESADYRQRQDYGPNDEVPVVLDGREVGRLAVRDLLPD